MLISLRTGRAARVACFVVFIGTMWPLASELFFDRKLSVGAPFFDAAFTPFMVALAVILPIGALMPWKRARLGRTIQPLWGVMALAIAAGALVWTMQTGRSALAGFGGLWGSARIASTISWCAGSR